jgi:hypothetical protein
MAISKIGKALYLQRVILILPGFSLNLPQAVRVDPSTGRALLLLATARQGAGRGFLSYN